MSTIAIIADGLWDEKCLQHSADIVIALDGAANKLLATSLVPDYIIGDLDSISEEATSIYKLQGVEILTSPDQNSTDLDKGILLAKTLSPSKIHIFNAQGASRLDHSLYNLKALRYHHSDGIEILMLFENQIIRYLKDTNFEFSGNLGDNFSAFGMPKAIITSNGLKYELDNYNLEFGTSDTACNSLNSEKISLKIDGEAIIIYKS